LLPYILDQMWSQWPDWQRWLQRDVALDQVKATGQLIDQPSWWQQVITTLGSLLANGPQRILQFVLAHKPGLGQWMTGLYWLVMLVVLMGAWRVVLKPTHRRWFAWMLLCLVSGVVLVTLLRSFTPFYMLLSLTPLLAGMMALCAHTVVVVYRPLLVVLTLALVVLGSVPFLAFHKASKHRQMNLGSVMNVNHQMQPGWWQSQNTLDGITIYESHALSSPFCDQNTVINGPYAAAVEMTGGALIHFYCDHYQLQLGGSVKPSHEATVFIMHKSFWDRMGLPPEDWISPSWGQTSRYQNHAPQTAVELAPFDDYVHPPRSNRPAGTVQSLSKSIETENAAYLVITHLMPTQMRFAVDEVKVNGQSLQPVMQNAVNRLYHCADCGEGAANWLIEYRSDDPTVIDFNTLSQ